MALPHGDFILIIMSDVNLHNLSLLITFNN